MSDREGPSPLWVDLYATAEGVAEIGLLGVFDSVFTCESLGDFPLTHACPIENVTL